MCLIIVIIILSYLLLYNLEYDFKPEVCFIKKKTQKNKINVNF